MGRHSDIPNIYDFCKQLSVSDLKKWNYLKPNRITEGVIRFTSFNYDILEVSIKVSTDIENPFIELKYLISGTELNYRVYFEFVPSNLGTGNIWYFSCPRSHTRCRKLYLINGYFQHRTAYNKGYYQTQTLGTKDKFLIRQSDKMTKANNAKSKLYSKNFKKHYNGKPTKQYLKLLKQIEAGGGISEAELLMK